MPRIRKLAPNKSPIAEKVQLQQTISRLSKKLKALEARTIPQAPSDQPPTSASPNSTKPPAPCWERQLKEDQKCAKDNGGGWSAKCRFNSVSTLEIEIDCGAVGCSHPGLSKQACRRSARNCPWKFKRMRGRHEGARKWIRAAGSAGTHATQKDGHKRENWYTNIGGVRGRAGQTYSSSKIPYPCRQVRSRPISSRARPRRPGRCRGSTKRSNHRHGFAYFAKVHSAGRVGILSPGAPSRSSHLDENHSQPESARHLEQKPSWVRGRCVFAGVSAHSHFLCQAASHKQWTRWSICDHPAPPGRGAIRGTAFEYASGPNLVWPFSCRFLAPGSAIPRCTRAHPCPQGPHGQGACSRLPACLLSLPGARGCAAFDSPIIRSQRCPPGLVRRGRAGNPGKVGVASACGQQAARTPQEQWHTHMVCTGRGSSHQAPRSTSGSSFAGKRGLDSSTGRGERRQGVRPNVPVYKWANKAGQRSPPADIPRTWAQVAGGRASRAPTPPAPATPHVAGPTQVDSDDEGMGAHAGGHGQGADDEGQQRLTQFWAPSPGTNLRDPQASQVSATAPVGSPSEGTLSEARIMQAMRRMLEETMGQLQSRLGPLESQVQNLASGLQFQKDLFEANRSAAGAAGSA